MIKKEDIKEGVLLSMPFANNRIYRLEHINGDLISAMSTDGVYFASLSKKSLIENGTLIEMSDLKNASLLQKGEYSPLTCNISFSKVPDRNNFEDITKRMNDTYKAKNHDYGNSFSELFKDCGMTYAYGHMAEKLSRVKSLMKDEAKVKGESMKDSLYDLANYAILTIMELEKEK